MRSALRRNPDGGIIAGVCAGVSEHFDVDVRLVRLIAAFVVVIGGVGVAIYALAWALIPVATGTGGERRPMARAQAALLVAVMVAVSVALRQSGLRVAESIVLPMVLMVCGMALAWRPTITSPGEPAGEGNARARVGVARAGRIDVPRVVVGGLLVVLASAALLHAAGVLSSLGRAIGAVVLVAATAAALTGPWFLRMARSLGSERAARIREQERAEVAAHLHDSVLQTLALIQKRAEDPREVAKLARRQERELRRWLLQRPGEVEAVTVATALQRAAAEVEELHLVPIEVVTVGDGPLDGRREALVQAAREAMTNAAKFAGGARVDIYAEVEPDRVEVYVRDRGLGFDPGEIPSDRRGVRDSIIGRMLRHEGRATVHSMPGAGTEIELVMERGAVA